MAKKKKIKPLICKVCQNQPPTGKCFICGLKRNPNEYVTKWLSRHEFLKITYDKLKKYKMTTTGDPLLDQEIRYYFGSWWNESLPDVLKRIEKLISVKGNFNE